MSHVPNNAIPHATPANETEPEPQGVVETVTDTAEKAGKAVADGAGKAGETVRRRPKTAIAVGVGAVLAGAVAAAAGPLGRQIRKLTGTEEKPAAKRSDRPAAKKTTKATKTSRAKRSVTTAAKAPAKRAAKPASSAGEGTPAKAAPKSRAKPTTRRTTKPKDDSPTQE